jgi:hypothetical protein
LPGGIPGADEIKLALERARCFCQNVVEAVLGAISSQKFLPLAYELPDTP